MSLCELQVKTLQGGVFTLDVREIETVEQLKQMLLEKYSWRSCGPENSESRGLARQLLTKRCSDTECKQRCRLSLITWQSYTDETKSRLQRKAMSVTKVFFARWISLRPQRKFPMRPSATAQNWWRWPFPIRWLRLGGMPLPAAALWKASPFPDSVTEIGRNAFTRCSSLKSITIPDSVAEIGYTAFAGCSSLESITIPNSVTQIGRNGFSGCRSLESITIPNSVTEIGWDAFTGCSSLESITIPDSVTEIGRNAFTGCSSLISITIPDSVAEIGYKAFAGCSSLKGITIPSSSDWDWEPSFLPAAALWKASPFPNSVTEIGWDAFTGCSSLESITIPDSVTEIGRICLYRLQRVETHHHSGFSGWDWIQSFCRLQLFERHHNSFFGDCRLRAKFLPAAAL